MVDRTPCAHGNRDPLHVVKPRFFPGQTLSDADLSAIVCWAEQRLRLHAACNDWGVACGLAVGVALDQPDRVTVGPGYGFDREMGLCIVEKQVEADLPCAACAGCDDDDPGTVLFPGQIIEYRLSTLRVYDALLAVNDIPEQKVLALSMDGRRQCKDARLRTSARLIIVPATTTPAQEPPALRFLDLLGHEQRLTDFLGSKIPWDESQFSSAMNAWLDRIRQDFPGLQLPWPSLPDSWGTRDEARANLSWLVFAFRRLRGCCEAVRNPTIPVARIWAVCSGNEQRIVWIDDAAPHRRTLHCCSGGFKLQHWIGEPFAAAQEAARIWGVGLDSEPLGNLTFEEVKELKAYAQKEIELAGESRPGSRLTAVCYKSPEYKINNGQVLVLQVERIFAWRAAAQQAAQGVAAGTGGEPLPGDAPAANAANPAVDPGVGGSPGS